MIRVRKSDLPSSSTSDPTGGQPTAPEDPSRRSKRLIFVLLFLAVGFLAAGVLYDRGYLQPVVEFVRHMLPGAETPPPPAVELPVASVPEAWQPVNVPVQPENVEPPPPVRPLEMEKEGDLEAMYRLKFKPPKWGSRLNLALLGGDRMTGVLDSIDKDGVALSDKNVCITVNRSRLTPASRAACYEDDYVTFMLALNKRLVAEQKARDELVEKMLAAYKQQLGLKGSASSPAKKSPPPTRVASYTPGEATAPAAEQKATAWQATPWALPETTPSDKNPQPPRASSATAVADASAKPVDEDRIASRTTPRPSAPDVSVQDADFKAFLEKNGGSAQLRERQRRIAEYEAERRAANREY